MRGLGFQLRTVSTALALLLGAGILVEAGAGPASARPAGRLAPPRGVLLGAYVDPDGRWTGNADAIAEAAAFERALGRKLDINHHYYAWTDTFPSGLEQEDLRQGRIPLVSWAGPSLDEILSGRHDALITARADGLRSLGAPVFLRWCWEMNGNWYPCDGSHNNDAGTKNGPAKFVAAWRRIHDIFTARGATNVVWVWAPNHVSVPDKAWNHWSRYYPGDAYVDWVGIDGYNWGTSRSWSSWASFRSIFRDVYDDYAARKPIMIVETASVEQGGSKAAWIRNARKKIKAALPSIAAFLWFDVRKENDWRVGSSSAAFRAYRALASDRYFGGEGQNVARIIREVAVSPRHFRKRTRVSFKLVEDATLTAKVRRGGKVVRRLVVGAGREQGRHVVVWNGRDNDGKRVAAGWYRVRLVTRSASGRSVRNVGVHLLRGG